VLELLAALDGQRVQK